MSFAPGWYTRPDGQQRYWDGAQWTNHVAPAAPIAPAPQSAPTVKHRRNHAVAAIGFIIAALLIGFGLLFPYGVFTLLKGADLLVTPTHDFALDETSAALLLAIAIFLAILGLLLLITRVRYLGVLWRILGLAAIVVPAIYAFTLWSFINDPTVTMKEQSNGNVFSEAFALVSDASRGSGWDLTAGLGLWLLSAGVVCGILAALIPAIRRQEVSYT
ncbi:DUF2510 domain-containing protein [Leifsonia sp. NPDC077715]|uniref:DUF2510 domain-containing protein n=1 Tax=Leifsonia sp. NPDC077715 TaxID=3155539 RepID=UPI00342335AE